MTSGGRRGLLTALLLGALLWLLTACGILDKVRDDATAVVDKGVEKGRVALQGVVQTGIGTLRDSIASVEHDALKWGSIGLIGVCLVLWLIVRHRKPIRKRRKQCGVRNTAQSARLGQAAHTASSGKPSRRPRRSRRLRRL